MRERVLLSMRVWCVRVRITCLCAMQLTARGAHEIVLSVNRGRILDGLEQINAADVTEEGVRAASASIELQRVRRAVGGLKKGEVRISQRVGRNRHTHVRRTHTLRHYTHTRTHARGNTHTRTHTAHRQTPT